jgi:peptidoglycan/LPS O-acetylase OafA/YrhL
MAAAVTLFAVGLLIWIPVENPLMYTFGFTILYLGFGFLLARVVEMKPLPLGPVAWLGGYSYSIYLWHLPIARLLPHGTPFACFVILSVVAGFLARIWSNGQYFPAGPSVPFTPLSR